jgi:hypothetical protein
VAEAAALTEGEKGVAAKTHRRIENQPDLVRGMFDGGMGSKGINHETHKTHEMLTE